jgi:hypothetical protein
MRLRIWRRVLRRFNARQPCLNYANLRKFSRPPEAERP